MAFIGNTPTTQAFTPAVDYFSGNGSTTAFTLSRPVASVAQVEAVIDNVVQNPSSAYTVSANTITFTSAPLSGTNNIYVRYTSPITQVIAPGQGTVNTTALGNITNIASGNSSLTLQTGSGNTTAVTVDTSQNVGIGTTPTYKLDVASTSSIVARFARTSFATAYVVNAATESYFSADSSGNNGFGADATNGRLVFWANSAERMRIDSAGSVAIGSTSTASATRLTLKGAGTGGNTLFNCQDSGGTALLTLAENGNLSFNSGYGSNATAYGCRAWVIFNGTAASVIKSGGVTSITRASAGNYTINFSFTMPDATYSALTGDYSYGCGWNDALTTTSFSTKRMGGTYGVLADNAQNYAAVFR